MDDALSPKCIAQSKSNEEGNGNEYAIREPSDSYKNVQWTADGTCLIATSDANDIRTFVVPADLLADRDEPLGLSGYCAIPSGEPVNAVVGFPSFQLQDPATTLVLSSIREHPIRLSSALSGHLVASYPLVNSMTEEYIAPHSLASSPTGAHVIAGSDSLISVFDISRAGQGPVTSVKTGPKNRSDDRWNPATSMRGIVSALAIDTASGILAAGTFTRHIALYNSYGQGDCIGSFSVQGNEADKTIGGRGITQVHWSACGRYLYIAERKSDGVMIYDIRQTGQLLSWTTGRGARTNQRLGLDVCDGSSSGSYEVWAGGTDGKVRMWKDAHLQEGAVKPSFESTAHEDAVTSTIVHRAGGVLATCSGKQRPSRDNERPGVRATAAGLRLWSL